MTKTIIKILIIALISLNISNTFADYKYKIEDRIKINRADKKISEYLSNKKNSYFLAKRLKNKIEKILGKNEKEIIKKYNNGKSIYKDFKEYALTHVYGKIEIINNSVFKNKVQYSVYTYKETILRNDYIKILVDKKYIGDDKIELNNKALSITYSNGYKVNHLKFFKIKPEEKTENYLKNNILNKNGKIGCELIESKSNFNRGKAYYFGLKKKYQSKEAYPGSAICPSEFTKGYSNNGINYFQRISPNTLIYVNAGQDYAGIDFSSMEIK